MGPSCTVLDSTVPYFTSHSPVLDHAILYCTLVVVIHADSLQNHRSSLAYVVAVVVADVVAVVVVVADIVFVVAVARVVW